MKYSDDEDLREFIKAWGVDSQIDLAIEECAELIVALKHFKRERVTPDDVFIEIADVVFMMEELTLIFGPSTSKADIGIPSQCLLENAIKFKRDRTVDRMKEKKEKDKTSKKHPNNKFMNFFTNLFQKT